MAGKIGIMPALQEIRQSKRKFKQTVDLIVTLQNFDPKKQENRISKDIALPHGLGREMKIGIISDSVHGSITKQEIELMKSKKEIKSFIGKYDSFICDVSLMAFVGKTLGKYLAPIGKMPSPFPPNANAEAIVRQKQSSVRIKSVSSCIQLPIGSEEMPDEKLKENIEKALSEIETALPKGRPQMKSAMLKLTMSKPVKIEY